MKKHLIIGVSTVIILIATICAVTFAAWDITGKSIEIGKIKTPTNIQLKVNDVITAPTSNLKLVPDHAAKSNTEAYMVGMGTFRLNLSAADNTPENEIASRVKMTISAIDITTTVSGVTNINERVEVLILLPDADNGSDFVLNNVSAKYKRLTAEDEIVVNTTYTVAIRFVAGYGDKYGGNDAMINTKPIKVVLNFNCILRPEETNN